MEYRVTYRSRFEKTIKKLRAKNPRLVEEILQQADLIQADPTKYESLTGNLKGFQTAHFHRAPEYRIMFRVYTCRKEDKSGKVFCELGDVSEDDAPQDCRGLIDFIFVETREVFNRLYNLPKGQLKNYIY